MLGGKGQALAAGGATRVLTLDPLQVPRILPVLPELTWPLGPLFWSFLHPKKGPILKKLKANLKNIVSRVDD